MTDKTFKRIFTNKKALLYPALFLATLFSTTFFNGIAYALTIMTILMAHEMGHYLMCKRYGVRATFPIFIPMPNLFGTLGAVIAMKSPIPNRKALFDIGIAGPLAGLALAIPAIVVGLYLSEVKAIPDNQPLIQFGEPILFSFISRLIVGPIPENMDIFLHPIAFAGWAVLFITAINLFPVGQLDGGHISVSIFGKKSKLVAWSGIAVLVFLGYHFDPLWWIFAGFILIFVFRHPPPLDESQSIGKTRVFLGLFAYVLMILCFTPIPIRILNV